MVQAESHIKLANLLIKRQPRLEPFIQQSKCVVTSAIKALLKLVAKEDSGKPESLSDEFDVQLEKDGVSKSFTKRGGLLSLGIQLELS